MNYLTRNILTLITAMLPFLAHAGALMVNSSIDSTTMLMGSKTAYRIEVVQDKGVKGEFPLFKSLAEAGYVTLLNDTIEISAASLPDTVEIGSNRIQINYNMLIQVFDSGYYKIPGLEYVAGKDTVRSKSHFLKVTPMNVTADDKISPMTDVQAPEDSSIFDILPDWLVKWWWILLLLAVLGYAGYRLVKRYRQTGSILPPKPEVPAHIEALERLKRLKARHIWEDGKEKEYYTILTDILRLYLDRRFGIKAMEMTSKEIMSTLADDRQLMSSNELIRQILKIADFVKFAKVRPLPDDNVKAFDNAVKFVEDTAPRETDASVEENVSDTSNISGGDDTRKGGEV